MVPLRMRPLVAVLAGLSLSAACSKSSSSSASSQAPSSVANAAPATAAAAETAPSAGPRPAAEVEERKEVVTEALVEKYLVYLKEVVPARAATLQKLGDEWGHIEKEKGLRQGVDAIRASEKYQKAFEELEQRSRAKAGLSDEEVRRASSAVDDVTLPRMLLKEHGMEAQLAAMETQMKAALAQLPPEQRAEAEKELKETSESLKKTRESTEAREKYGDAVVEVILKHEAEFVALQKQAMGVEAK